MKLFPTITIVAPAIKSNTVAIVITTNVHLVNITHSLDITNYQLCQLILWTVSHTEDFIKYLFFVLFHLGQLFCNYGVGNDIAYL